MNCWVVVSALATVVGVIVAAFALCYAIENLKKFREQTEYVRKQVFGEVFDEAQVKDLHFFLPEKRKHEVEGFEQNENQQINLGQAVTIPLGSERELHIGWTMAKGQTLRGYSLGFGEEYNSKPEILRIRRAFVKKSFQKFTREEYIDWHGDFHCEYAHKRRLPENEPFVTAVRVIGRVAGDYKLQVSVIVDEAPKPFRGELTVTVKV